ncbi:Protein C25F9.2 protein [Aphelenchoides avenae]|nr:Protein C25F9.2 protein [Aphelenchus avenae]
MSAIDLNIHELNIVDQSVTYGEAEMEKLQTYFDDTSPGRYRIVAFSQHTDTHAIWKGQNTAKLNICIYHHTDNGATNGHYEAAKTAEKLFARGKYCFDCEVTYSKDSYHSAKCKSKCINCLRVGYGFPCHGTDRIHCNGCNKIFTSRECYEKHHEVACRMYRKCEKCGKYWRPDMRKPKKGEPAPPEPEHQCELPFCRLCRMAHRKEEPCFVSPPRLPMKKSEYRIISWDFECQVHRKVDNDTKVNTARANCVVALVTCSKCIREERWKDLDRADCEICGPQKVYAKGEWECPDGLTKELVDWFLQLPKKYKTYAYSHNGAHYDDNFVMQELYNRGGMKPKILSNGNKMFEVRLPRNNHRAELILRDSNLLFPMKLSAVKDTFRLECEAKPWFPYMYNRSENYNEVITGVPPIKDYCPGNMTEKELKQFKAWYGEQLRNWNNIRFDLKKELREYCMSDCNNLLHALVAFRKLFNDLSGFDNMAQSCTLTSGCLRIYKHRFVKRKTIGIIPPHGYGPFDRQSNKGMKFVKWVAEAHGVGVKHRDNGGEKRVEHTDPVRGKKSTYKLDGYIEAAQRQSPNFKECGVDGCVYCEQAPDKDVAIEFNGCYFHGCDVCMKNDCKGVGGRPTDELWQATMEREEHLKQQGLFVWRVQECVFDKHFKKDDDMKEFYC